MTSTVPIILPGGLWCHGVRYQEAELRPLVGADEAFLLEEGEMFLPAQKITALLTRCVTRIGPVTPVTPETLRSLTVGDREALLLHLRRLTLGNPMPAVLSCPYPACSEKMDLGLQVSDFLLPPYACDQEWHETTVTAHGIAYGIRFRLPTGADQEAGASLARSDPYAAAELILRRCVAQVTLDAGQGASLAEWPPPVAQQLPALMSELDPQAELVLQLTCPACRGAFSALFDTASYFFQELVGQATSFYREVHTLAFYYHWSEAEILSLTAKKRHRYLDLLAEALTKEGRR